MIQCKKNKSSQEMDTSLLPSITRSLKRGVIDTMIGNSVIFESNQQLDAILTASSITCARSVIDVKTSNTQQFFLKIEIQCFGIPIIIVITRKVNWSICVMPWAKNGTIFHRSLLFPISISSTTDNCPTS